jgi:hypothetical protein
MSSPFLIFLRREPAADRTPRKTDIIAYLAHEDGTPNLSAPAARWPWYFSNKPQRRTRKVTLNCVTYAPVWLRPSP